MMGEQTPRNIQTDPPGRLDSPAGREEPERQVYSNERIKEYEDELQNRWEVIMALRDVVIKQRMTILSLKAKLQDVAEPNFPSGEIRQEASTLSKSDNNHESDSGEEATPDASPVISFPSFQRSEQEDEMSAITCEAAASVDSSDSLQMENQKRDVLDRVKEQMLPVKASISIGTLEASKREGQQDINDVIESIEEQATHVDAVIALEKLQTTSSELQVVSNKLRERNTEVGELQNRVDALECQIATLELERDLHIVEASRARDDLKECIQYISNLRTNDDEGENHLVSPKEATASTSNDAMEAFEPEEFATPEKASNTSTSTRPRQGEQRNIGSTDWSTPSTQVSSVTHQSVFPRDEHSISSFSSDGHPRRRCSEPRNLALCFWSQRGKESFDNGPAFERMVDGSPPSKRASLFRRLQKKQKNPRKRLPSNRKDEESCQQAKATELKHSLAVADREAGELRARLDSITRYCDNLAVSLHQSASSHRTVSTEVEADVTNQLSFLDIEKRSVMAELKQKDALVEKIQKEIARLVQSSAIGHSPFPVQESAQLI